MCQRFLQLLLGGLFLFVMGTVAAFRYLEWWQAPLASAGLFLAVVAGVRWVIVRAARRLGMTIQEAFTSQGVALRGATAQVHRVRRTEAGDGGDRYEIELTVFPPPIGAETSWNPGYLRLATFDAPAMIDSRSEALELAELGELTRLVNGEEEPVGEGTITAVFGPERLRFVAEVPHGWRAARLQYFFEGFGRIDFPRLALPPRE